MSWIIENFDVIKSGVAQIIAGFSILAACTPKKTTNSKLGKVLQIIDLLAVNTKTTVTKTDLK